MMAGSSVVAAAMVAMTTTVLLADTPAVGFAGRLLVELGAAVELIEPPEGSALRRFPPLVEGDSATFAYLAAGMAARAGLMNNGRDATKAASTAPRQVNTRGTPNSSSRNRPRPPPRPKTTSR